jgi:hypothetical protein
MNAFTRSLAVAGAMLAGTATVSQAATPWHGDFDSRYHSTSRFGAFHDSADNYRDTRYDRDYDTAYRNGYGGYDHSTWNTQCDDTAWNRNDTGRRYEQNVYDNRFDDRWNSSTDDWRYHSADHVRSGGYDWNHDRPSTRYHDHGSVLNRSNMFEPWRPTNANRYDRSYY